MRAAGLYRQVTTATGSDAMPDHEPRTTNLTLTAGEFAALHEQVLSDGGRAAEDVLDPCRRAALAELVAWLPDLTAEAYDDAIIPRGRRTLPAAGAWLADAALGHDPRDAAGARAPPNSRAPDSPPSRRTPAPSR